MKKYALPLALTSILALQACNEPATAPEAAAEAPAASLETLESRWSYSIAFNMGQNVGTQLEGADVEAFVLGVRDGIAGKDPRLTQEEMEAALQELQEGAQKAQMEAQAAVAGENLKAGMAYLVENATKEGVVVTDSGLQYRVAVAGDGARPGPEDTVEVHYHGTLIDGTEFDSSIKRGQSVSFGVGQVIAGWTEALQLMSVGSKWQLTIPADLAYGAAGAGGAIGPNATLLFDVELISIAGQEAQQPAAE